MPIESIKLLNKWAYGRVYEQKPSYALLEPFKKNKLIIFRFKLNIRTIVGVQ